MCIRDSLDTSSESNVNKILDNLAHKFYYENYMNGERNLSGTVSIASNGIVSSFQKALTTDQKEGAITWQNGNGQGSYAAPTPAPTPVTPVTPAPSPVTPVTPTPTPVSYTHLYADKWNMTIRINSLCAGPLIILYMIYITQMMTVITCIDSYHRPYKV